MVLFVSLVPGQPESLVYFALTCNTIAEMFNLNVITIGSVHFNFFFFLLKKIISLGHHTNNNFGAGLNEIVL